MIGGPDAHCTTECHTGDFADFDHYCDAKGIQPGEEAAAFGAWLHALSGWDGPQGEVRPTS